MRTAQQVLVPLDARDEWERALDGLLHAFAHTWGSCHAMQLTTGWPTYLYVLDDGTSRVACAIAERETAGSVDVVTPYGFGGFTGRAPEDLLERWRGFARSRGYVCGYLGLNPLLAPVACTGSPDYGEHNDVHVLDLDRGHEALFRGLSSNRRRQIRAFEAGSRRVVDDQARLGEHFLGGIDDFLTAGGASPTYAFTDATWRALLALDEVFLLGVEEADGALAAVSAFASTPWCGEFLFGVSTPEGRAYSAVLVWAAAVRLGERGVARLNLGGGVTRGDGIAGFKARFGGTRLPLGALRQVYRQDEYQQLCRVAGRDPDDRTGFFPPYRAPGPGLPPALDPPPA